MKNRLNFFNNVTFRVMAIFGIVFLSFACSEEEDAPAVIPSAGFTYSHNGLEVTFSNTSTDAVSQIWDFGDNTGSSVEASPTYTYAAAGSYDVVLTVTSSSGDVDSETMSVTIAESAVIPVAGFSYSADNLTVTFTNSSTDAVSYSWDFGDQSAASTDENPVYTYAEAGSYTVILTAISSTSDSETETMDVTVEAAGIDPALFTNGNGNYFDVFSGEAGSQNVGDWIQDTFSGIKPTYTAGVANPDASDTSHPLVGKYERIRTEENTATDGKYVRIYVKPSAIPLTWGERTVFSIRVYMPAANDYDNTLTERKIAMKLRTTAGSSSEISVTKTLDASADDTWTTVEFDLSEATGGTDRVFDPNQNYDRLLIQLGGEMETEGRGFWYLSDFVRL